MRFPVATIPVHEAGALPGARLHRTSPAHPVRLSRPDGLSRADWWALRDRDVERVPEQWVLEFPGATVAGRDGWVVAGGRVVDGLWQEAGFPVGQMLPRGFEADRVRITGTTASLLMPWLPNYYHWTVQCVPRVHRVREAVGEVDQWLVPAGAPAYVGQWLDVLGIPVEQRVEVGGRRRLLDLERLVVSSVPGRNRWVLPREVDALRSHFPSPVAGGRRIYVTRPRADRRRVVNDEEVAAVAGDLGFDLVDLARLSVREEVALFASASVVAGVHGAGLTNLVFCAPGTQVVELTPRGLVYPTFAKLAEASGVSHRFLLGVEPRLPWPLRFPDVESDLVVDVRAFASTLERVVNLVS